MFKSIYQIKKVLVFLCLFLIIVINNAFGASAVFDAIGKGDLESVKQIVNVLEPDLSEVSSTHNPRDWSESTTPLAYALCNRELEIAEYLISKGADVNQVIEQKVYRTKVAYPTSVLDLAIKHATWIEVKLLIKNGADPINNAHFCQLKSNKEMYIRKGAKGLTIGLLSEYVQEKARSINWRKAIPRMQTLSYLNLHYAKNGLKEPLGDMTIENIGVFDSREQSLQIFKIFADDDKDQLIEYLKNNTLKNYFIDCVIYIDSVECVELLHLLGMLTLEKRLISENNSYYERSYNNTRKYFDSIIEKRKPPEKEEEKKKATPKWKSFRLF